LPSNRLSALLAKYNPAVTNRWHIALAGVTWGLVGLLLCRYSYGWLAPLQFPRAILFGFLGVLIAAIVYWYGMSKIARKNLSRLQAIKGKTCIFGFLTWRSYVNIALMVTLGVTLRHSAVPKDYLSLVYTSMGGGLLLGSIQYYRSLFL
jgi:hypothetical protein